jgi:hypothetical protein
MELISVNTSRKSMYAPVRGPGPTAISQWTLAFYGAGIGERDTEEEVCAGERIQLFRSSLSGLRLSMVLVSVNTTRKSECVPVRGHQ